MVRQIEQEAVGFACRKLLDQTGDHEVVVQHSIVVAVVSRQLVIGDPVRHALAVGELVVFRRVAVLVAHVRAQQVDDDELARRAVGQNLAERLEYVTVVLTGVLVKVVVQVDLLIGLLGEGGEHGVALGHGLLVGDPVGLVTRLLHHVHDRRRGQVGVRILLIGKGQHLLQGLDGVGPRRHHVVEHRQLLAQFIQLRRGRPRIAVQAHALAIGRLADHQHQGAGLTGLGILQLLQGRHLGIAIQQQLHVAQLLQIFAIAHHQLPWHRRLDPRLELFQGSWPVTVLVDLLAERVSQQSNKQCQAEHQCLVAAECEGPYTLPQQPGAEGVEQVHRHHPPGEILGEVLAAFGHVRLEHDKDHALRELLAVDAEVAQSHQGAGPQQQANAAGNRPRPRRKQQHRNQPEGTEQKRLAKTGKAGGAGQLDQQVRHPGEIPEEQEQPAQACPIPTLLPTHHLRLHTTHSPPAIVASAPVQPGCTIGISRHFVPHTNAGSVKTM